MQQQGLAVNLCDMGVTMGTHNMSLVCSSSLHMANYKHLLLQFEDSEDAQLISNINTLGRNHFSNFYKGNSCSLYVSG